MKKVATFLLVPFFFEIFFGRFRIAEGYDAIVVTSIVEVHRLALA